MMGKKFSFTSLFIIRRGGYREKTTGFTSFLFLFAVFSLDKAEQAYSCHP
jgi:hypothetical protein